MQIKFSDLRFYIFFFDKSMFSLWIYRYSKGKFLIEVLKIVKVLNLLTWIKAIAGADQSTTLGVMGHFPSCFVNIKQ